jgi:hypothetical protein
MSFITAAAIAAGVGGATKIASGIIGSGQRKAEQRNAQSEFSRNKAAYENSDTSNAYANQENTMEDLTINTQQADMVNSQNQQNLGNVMGGMNAAAGGSGIAGLAQAMAGQQANNAQAASASIGQQESQNQMRSANMQAQLNSNEIGGEMQSRAARQEKVDTMLGMSQNRVKDANAARDQATQAILGGVGQIGAMGMNDLGAIAAVENEL